MPVKHDLLADLHITREDFDKRKAADPRLSHLHDKYLSKDAEVVEAEDAAADDGRVNRLRSERLKIKDEIVTHLS